MSVTAACIVMKIPPRPGPIPGSVCVLLFMCRMLSAFRPKRCVKVEVCQRSLFEAFLWHRQCIEAVSTPRSLTASDVEQLLQGVVFTLRQLGFINEAARSV